MEIEKSANQLYKESGSTLHFTDWIAQEKEKNFIKNDSLSKLIEAEEAKLKKQFSNSKPNTTLFGLNKNVIIVSGIIILTAIAFKIIYKKS